MRGKGNSHFQRKEAIGQCSSCKATIGINLVKKWSRKESLTLRKWNNYWIYSRNKIYISVHPPAPFKIASISNAKYKTFEKVFYQQIEKYSRPTEKPNRIKLHTFPSDHENICEYCHKIWIWRGVACDVWCTPRDSHVTIRSTELATVSPVSTAWAVQSSDHLRAFLLPAPAACTPVLYQASPRCTLYSLCAPDNLPVTCNIIRPVGA